MQYAICNLNINIDIFNNSIDFKFIYIELINLSDGFED